MMMPQIDYVLGLAFFDFNCVKLIFSLTTRGLSIPSLKLVGLIAISTYFLATLLAAFALKTLLSNANYDYARILSTSSIVSSFSYSPKLSPSTETPSAID